MSKGVAVQKIILLILGIIVLAIVGYLLYSVFVKAGPNLEMCNAAVTTACGQCKLSGWNKEVTISGLHCSENILNGFGISANKDPDSGNFKISCSESSFQDACSLRGIEPS
ncbi:MAG: hypothetical protein QXJ14_01595 [Candidatus Aenigmatarchaeota archaeon]